MLETALTRLLSISLPIVVPGMSRVTSPALVIAVCNAGGLGTLSGLAVDPQSLRAQIREVRTATDRPFAVNLWLHDELRPPPAIDSVDRGVRRQVDRALDGIRAKLSIHRPEAPPTPVPDTVDAAIDVIIEERVPVLSTIMAIPDAQLVARCHEAGIRVMATVATMEDARATAENGADIIVAQGAEAGGHRAVVGRPAHRESASVGTMTLVPEVVDAVSVPVVAAGGIADGRGLVAALALGASGVMMGTRFVAVAESAAPTPHREAIVTGRSHDTVVTEAITGLPMRAVENALVREYEATRAPVLPGLLQAQAAMDIFEAAAPSGRREYLPLPAGQVMGRIEDVPTAADVLQRVQSGAEAELTRLAKLTR